MTRFDKHKLQDECNSTDCIIVSERTNYIFLCSLFRLCGIKGCFNFSNKDWVFDSWSNGWMRLCDSHWHILHHQKANVYGESCCTGEVYGII